MSDLWRAELRERKRVAPTLHIHLNWWGWFSVMQGILALVMFEMFHAPVLLVMWVPLVLANFTLLQHLGLLPLSARQIGNYLFIRLAVLPALLATPVILLRAPHWEAPAESFMLLLLDYTFAPLAGFAGCALVVSMTLLTARLSEEVSSGLQRQLLGILPMGMGFAIVVASFTTHTGPVLPSRWSQMDGTSAIVLAVALLIALTGFTAREALVRSLYAYRPQGKSERNNGDVGTGIPRSMFTSMALRNRWHYGKYGVLGYFIGLYSGRALLIFVGMATIYRFLGMPEATSSSGILLLTLTHVFVSTWFEQILSSTRILPVRAWKPVSLLPLVWFLCQWPVVAVHLTLSSGKQDFLPHYFFAYFTTLSLCYAIVLRFRSLPALVLLIVPPMIIANCLIFLPSSVCWSMALGMYVWGHVWLCRMVVSVKPTARLAAHAR